MMTIKETSAEIARTERLASLLTGADQEAAMRYIADLKRASVRRPEGLAQLKGKQQR